MLNGKQQRLLDYVTDLARIGEPLPPIDALAKRFNAAKTTIMAALDALDAEGLIRQEKLARGRVVTIVSTGKSTAAIGRAALVAERPAPPVRVAVGTGGPSPEERLLAAVRKARGGRLAISESFAVDPVQARLREVMATQGEPQKAPAIAVSAQPEPLPEPVPAPPPASSVTPPDVAQQPPVRDRQTAIEEVLEDVADVLDDEPAPIADRLFDVSIDDERGEAVLSVWLNVGSVSRRATPFLQVPLDELAVLGLIEGAARTMRDLRL